MKRLFSLIGAVTLAAMCMLATPMASVAQDDGGDGGDFRIVFDAPTDYFDSTNDFVDLDAGMTGLSTLTPMNLDVRYVAGLVTPFCFGGDGEDTGQDDGSSTSDPTPEQEPIGDPPKEPVPAGAFCSLDLKMRLG